LALHILADKEELLLQHEYVDIFQALVNAGTHLDTASDNGETFLILLKKNVMRSKQKVIINPYYESLLNTVFLKKEPVLSADSQRLAMD
jgi:hypothetical protein